MISCTEFIPAYSELFTFLENKYGRAEVDNFWEYLFKPTGDGIPLVNFVKIWLIDRTLLGNYDITIPVNLVISLTLVVEIICAKIIGCTLPIIAKKMKFDPAVMSSPFITTIVDAISLLVYFTFATAILHI